MPLNLTCLERIGGVKQILETVFNEGRRQTSEEKSKDERLSESLKESKASFFNKIEGSSKILSELETRLFQSEKEKVASFSL